CRRSRRCRRVGRTHRTSRLRTCRSPRPSGNLTTTSGPRLGIDARVGMTQPHDTASSGSYLRSPLVMSRVDAADELGKELTQLRADANRLAERAAAAERDAQRYRLLLSHLEVGVFVSSLDGRMLECNDRTVEMSGETR